MAFPMILNSCSRRFFFREQPQQLITVDLEPLFFMGTLSQSLVGSQEPRRVWDLMEISHREDGA